VRRWGRKSEDQKVRKLEGGGRESEVRARSIENRWLKSENLNCRNEMTPSINNQQSNYHPSRSMGPVFKSTWAEPSFL